MEYINSINELLAYPYIRIGAPVKGTKEFCNVFFVKFVNWFTSDVSTYNITGKPAFKLIADIKV